MFYRCMAFKTGQKLQHVMIEALHVSEYTSASDAKIKAHAVLNKPNWNSQGYYLLHY